MSIARISYNTMDEAMAARYAERQDRITAATGHDHTPRPVDETTAIALLAATGETANGITVSDTNNGEDLIAIGHHTPETFMAAVHAITAANHADDPFSLFDNLYGEAYNGTDFADMTDWGIEDVWHGHAIVIEHGDAYGDPGTPEAAGCQCIDYTWAIREVPAGTDGALAVTLYQSTSGEMPERRYAHHFGPEKSYR